MGALPGRVKRASLEGLLCVWSLDAWLCGLTGTTLKSRMFQNLPPENSWSFKSEGIPPVW
jgi:hypothetical protein